MKLVRARVCTGRFSSGSRKRGTARCIRHEGTLFPQQCADTVAFTSAPTRVAIYSSGARHVRLHNVPLALAFHGFETQLFISADHFSVLESFFHSPDENILGAM